MVLTMNWINNNGKYIIVGGKHKSAHSVSFSYVRHTIIFISRIVAHTLTHSLTLCQPFSITFPTESFMYNFNETANNFEYKIGKFSPNLSLCNTPTKRFPRWRCKLHVWAKAHKMSNWQIKFNPFSVWIWNYFPVSTKAHWISFNVHNLSL